MHNAFDSKYEEITRINKYLFFKDKEKSQEAYNRLFPVVEKVRKHKLDVLNEINKLETKKALGISNEVEQKNRVNREFLQLLEEEKKGNIKVDKNNNYPITNGILIYGSSKEKDNFIDWIAKSSGAVVKKIKHNGNADETMDKITELAEKSETAFQHSNTRTLLVIDGLDEMLTNEDDFENIMAIDEFKGFVETLSRDYHMTIITKTDKPLDEFEDASIASHRFGIKVDLKME